MSKRKVDTIELLLKEIQLLREDVQSLRKLVESQKDPLHIVPYIQPVTPYSPYPSAPIIWGQTWSQGQNGTFSA
jgi:hypothetical protein